MKFNKFLIIGGDLRSYHLYKILLSNGNKAKLYGFNNYSLDKTLIKNDNNLFYDLKNTEIIIGSIPFSSGENIINAPYSKTQINIDSIINNMNEDQIFIAGRIDEYSKNLAKKKNIRMFDILEREEMSIMNAIPTAEGAIQIALEQMKTTLHNSNVLICGYGRIGKVLTNIIKAFSSKVYVLGKSYENKANIETNGCIYVEYTTLNGFLPKMDLIINTVPLVIFDKTNLKCVKENCLFIDLASKPFGIDIQVAKSENVNVIFAPSLPGKVAPISAANYINSTITNILNDIS